MVFTVHSAEGILYLFIKEQALQAAFGSFLMVYLKHHVNKQTWVKRFTALSSRNRHHNGSTPSWTPTYTHELSHALATIPLRSTATAIALSPDDKFAAVVAGAETKADLKIYCTKTHQLVETTDVGSGHIFSLKFAPTQPRHGGYMLSASKAPGKVILWDLSHHGKLIDPSGPSTPGEHGELSKSLARDVTSILVTDHGWDKERAVPKPVQEDIMYALWQALDLHQKAHAVPVSLSGDFVMFSPDGSFIITAATYDAMSAHTKSNEPLIIWDVRTRKARHVLRCTRNKIWWATVSPDSNLMAFGDRDTVVRIWNAQTDESEVFLKFPNRAFRDGVFSPDSKYIALSDCKGDSNTTVFVYCLATKSRVACFPNVARCDGAISWNLDGSLLAMLGAAGEISLWDAVNGVTRMQWRLDSVSLAYPDTLQFAAHGRKLVFTSIRGMTDVYDLTTLRLYRFAGEMDTIRKVVCAADGTFLAVMEGETLRFWALE
ncbi:Quino protein amine dehydrogenase [Aspergillus varians]